MPEAGERTAHGNVVEPSFRDALLDILATGAEAAAAPAAAPAGCAPFAARPARAVEPPPLVRALDDHDPRVVAFAARLAGRSEDALAIAHLARLLGHPDERVLEAALAGLARLREALTPAACGRAIARAPWLLRSAATLLGDAAPGPTARVATALVEDPAVTGAVVAAFGQAGVREGVPLLVAALRAQPAPATLARCLRALGAALQREAHPRALHAVEHWVRLTLAEAEVPALAVRLRRALGDDGGGEERNVRRVVAALARALATDPLFTVLLVAGCDPATRELWPYCPVGLAADEIPALQAGLVNPAPGVRLLACRCLAALGAAESAPWIEELLRDEDEEVRAVAIHTLARFRHDPAVPGLVRRLHDPSPLVRDAALLALARMDAELVAIALLCESLGDGALRAPALAVMRVNAHPAQQRFIESCLRDRRPKVRRAAVMALERQPEADLAAALQPLLDDASPAVRDAVTTALARRGGARARDVVVAQMLRARARRPATGEARLVEAIDGPPHRMAAARAGDGRPDREE
ncbi:MAG TPA: HEAT repeat domain-containing protein [Polyangia bacterium]